MESLLLWLCKKKLSRKNYISNLLHITQGVYRYSLKCARQRILLLFDFNSMKQEYNDYDGVTNSLLQENIELIVGYVNRIPQL